MPARAPAEEGSLLPRGFPTVADLAECESAEEKAELCDKADLLVERLEAKADSAEAFVDGPICAFFGFLKPNAIRNAEKARAAAEEAAAAAAALRRAAAAAPAAASSRAPSPPSSPRAPRPSSSAAAAAAASPSSRSPSPAPPGPRPSAS